MFSSISCRNPSAANIELRKQNQSLRDEIESLKRRQVADAATIAALEKTGVTSDTLSKQRLDQLYTAAGIELGKLTGGFDSDPAVPGDEAIRVQVTPTDLAGEPLKTAGVFRIVAIEKSDSQRQLGEWTFDIEQSKSAWLGQAFQYGYLLTCPLTTKTTSPEIVIKVTFVDALTQRQLRAEKSVKLAL